MSSIIETIGARVVVKAGDIQKVCMDSPTDIRETFEEIDDDQLVLIKPDPWTRDRNEHQDMLDMYEYNEEDWVDIIDV